jgi:hypothetical protein
LILLVFHSYDEEKLGFFMFEKIGGNFAIFSSSFGFE